MFLGRFGVWLAFRQEGWQHTPVLTFLRYFCKYRFSMPCTRAAAMAAGHTGQHWLQKLELQNALCVPETKRTAVNNNPIIKSINSTERARLCCVAPAPVLQREISGCSGVCG